jgi:hypothetical protein
MRPVGFAVQDDLAVVATVHGQLQGSRHQAQGVPVKRIAHGPDDRELPDDSSENVTEYTRSNQIRYYMTTVLFTCNLTNNKGEHIIRHSDLRYRYKLWSTACHGTYARSDVPSCGVDCQAVTLVLSSLFGN